MKQINPTLRPNYYVEITERKLKPNTTKISIKKQNIKDIRGIYSLIGLKEGLFMELPLECVKINKKSITIKNLLNYEIISLQLFINFTN